MVRLLRNQFDLETKISEFGKTPLPTPQSILFACLFFGKKYQLFFLENVD